MIAWDELYKRRSYGTPTQAVAMIGNLVPYLKASGVKSLIDVGCGRGHLLSIFSAAGFAVTGTEIVEELLKNDLSAYGVLPVDIATLIAEYPDCPWDFVCYCDVLQYLADDAEVALALSWAHKAAHGLAVAISTGEDRRDINWWYEAIETAGKAAGIVAAPHTRINDRAWIIWRTR